ncbi:MAG TPA: hypothetical protein PKZ02_00100 [Candidatus Paceibacterota bacterium]|nr:hypothetical protein [Candidatus Paceibacterota bacterium]
MVKEIVRQFCDGELTKEQGQLMIEHKNPFPNRIMEMSKSVGDGFRVVVNYSKSLDQMIESGNYDWVDSDISKKHFPIKDQGTAELNMELVHYNKFMSSDDVIKDLDSRNLRPAILPELLAFGASYPDKQREFLIVALVSIWQDSHGFRHVAFLCSVGSKPRLALGVWDSGWHDNACFLVVRK